MGSKKKESQQAERTLSSIFLIVYINSDDNYLFVGRVSNGDSNSRKTHKLQTFLKPSISFHKRQP